MPIDFYPGRKHDWDDGTNAFLYIDLEDAGAQGIRIQEYVSGQTAPSIEVENNAGTTQFRILSSATTTDAMTHTVAVTTGNGIAVTANALTTGDGVTITNTGEVMTSGSMLNASYVASGSTLAVLTGNVATFTLSIDETRSSGTTTMSDANAVSISRTSINTTASGTLVIGGAALLITTTSTETAGTLTDSSVAIEIVHSARNDGAGVFAMSITCDNPGTDFAGGIDMTSFAVDEPLIKFQTDSGGSNADPAAHSGVDDWICFENSANVLMFCPCYAAST